VLSGICREGALHCKRVHVLPTPPATCDKATQLRYTLAARSHAPSMRREAHGFYPPPPSSKPPHGGERSGHYLYPALHKKARVWKTL
jgi:hypothetical protein